MLCDSLYRCHQQCICLVVVFLAILVLVFSVDRASVSWSSFCDSGGGVSKSHAGLFSVCLLANESMQIYTVSFCGETAWSIVVRCLKVTGSLGVKIWFS